MRELLALLVSPWPALVLGGCTVGPKLVTAPMLEAAPFVPTSQDEGAVLSDDNPETGEITGTWQGRAWQVGNKSWPLTVTFDKPRGVDVTAHVQYPDQRCRAEWRLHSAEARHWAGEEAIEIDPLNRCPNHGRVTLEVIDEETVNWRWTSGGVTASATLERTGAH